MKYCNTCTYCIEEKEKDTKQVFLISMYKQDKKIRKEC